MRTHTLERQLSPTVLGATLRPLANFAIAIVLGAIGILIARLLR